MSRMATIPRVATTGTMKWPKLVSSLYLRSKRKASTKTTATLATSDGWKEVRPGSTSQLVAPPAVSPKRSTATSSPTVTTKNGIAALRYHR